MAISKNVGIGSDSKLSNKIADETAFITIGEVENFFNELDGMSDEFVIEDKFLLEFYLKKGDKNNIFTYGKVSDYQSHLSYRLSYTVGDELHEDILGGDSSVLAENVATSEVSFVKVSDLDSGLHVLANSNGDFLSYIVDKEQLSEVQNLKAISTKEHLDEDDITEELSDIILNSSLVVRTK